MIRKFRNFLFGILPNDATKFYNGAGGFTTPAGTGQIYKVGITVDGGGSVLTTGLKGFTSIPVAGNIVRARMLADQAGDCVIDVWNDTFANFPPDNTDSITSATPPTITSPAQSSDDTTLSSWIKAVAVGDVIGFNVDSATMVTRVTLELWIQP